MRPILVSNTIGVGACPPGQATQTGPPSVTPSLSPSRLAAKVKSGLSTRFHKITDGSLPPACWQHPVATADPSPDSPPSPVAPLALCVDAVPYAQRDSVIGFWCVQVRLQGMMQRENCAHVLALVLFSSRTRLVAKTPTRRRRVGPCAREQLPKRAAVVFIKGDWVQYAATFGCSPSFRSGHVCAARALAVGATLAMETPTTTTRAPGTRGRCGATKVLLPGALR